jgi:transmembrane sensor
MFAKGKINKKLIASYLTGNCPAADKHRVEQWIKASGKNAELFDQYKAVWTYAAPVADVPSFDSKSALDKVHHRIEVMEKSPSITFSRKPRKLYVAYRYAASIAAILVIAFSTYFFLQNQSSVETKTYTAEAKVLEPIILPDGSKVYLNKGATISYPEVFDGTNRLVTLTGEAYFEVETDPSWPFNITAGNLGIKVLGTSFNVNACSGIETVEVAVQNGKVLFYSFNPQSGDVYEQIILIGGEKGIYYKSDGLIARTIAENDNCIGWKSGVLEFNNTPLPEVLMALENAYELNFICDRSFDKLHLTARFNQEEPENILETLELIFGFQIEKDGSQIKIY